MSLAITIILVAAISYALGRGHKAEQADRIIARRNVETADARALADAQLTRVFDFHTTRRPVLVTPTHRLLDDEDPLALYDDCGIVLSTH